LKDANSATFDMSAATSVIAVLHDDLNTMSSEVTCSDTGGADWSTSLVEVVFTDTETSAFTSTGDAYVEIQVVIAGVKTRYRTSGVTVSTGFIA